MLYSLKWRVKLGSQLKYRIKSVWKLTERKYNLITCQWPARSKHKIRLFNVNIRLGEQISEKTRTWFFTLNCDFSCLDLDSYWKLIFEPFLFNCWGFTCRINHPVLAGNNHLYRRCDFTALNGNIVRALALHALPGRQAQLAVVSMALAAH